MWLKIKWLKIVCNIDEMQLLVIDKPISKSKIKSKSKATIFSKNYYASITYIKILEDTITTCAENKEKSEEILIEANKEGEMCWARNYALGEKLYDTIEKFKKTYCTWFN